MKSDVEFLEWRMNDCLQAAEYWRTTTDSGFNAKGRRQREKEAIEMADKYRIRWEAAKAKVAA